MFDCCRSRNRVSRKRVSAAPPEQSRYLSVPNPSPPRQRLSCKCSRRLETPGESSPPGSALSYCRCPRPTKSRCSPCTGCSASSRSVLMWLELTTPCWHHWPGTEDCHWEHIRHSSLQLPMANC